METTKWWWARWLAAGLVVWTAGCAGPRAAPSSPAATMPATAPATALVVATAPVVSGGAGAHDSPPIAAIGGDSADPAAPPVPLVPQPRAQRGPDFTPANLRASMNQMLDILFDLKNEAADPAEADQTLNDIAKFERDVAYCKLHTPPGVNQLAAGERRVELASYQVIMSNLMRTLLDLEDAVRDRKPDQIKKLLKQIDQIEEQRHAEFVPP